MKRLRFQYHTLYTFDIPIYDHYYTLKIYPREDERQQVESLVETMSYGDSYSYSRDSFGNKTVYGNINAPHDSFEFEVNGIVIVDAEKQDKDQHLLSLFRAPSSMTKPADNLKNGRNLGGNP